MPLPRRLPSLAWIFTLLLALGFLVWTQARRIDHLERLSAVSANLPVLDPASPTGYAGGTRVLLAPGHNNESYQWIAQTQQMLAKQEWRLRRVDYDNAPAGRAVISPSLYRWWLAVVAWGDQVWSGRSRGLAVERAALWADPLLLMLFVTGGTLLAACRFGPLTAALWPGAVVALFPLGGAFQPGAPDIVGLGLLLAAASALTLLAGILPAATSKTPSRQWFVLAGIFGGLGLWLNVRTAAPLLLGLGLGALAAGWFARRTGPVQPWRAWGVAGAITTFAAWLLEYAPAHLDLAAWRLGEIHPLYAAAWLGGGELLARVSRGMRDGKLISHKADYAWLGLATLALGSLPLAMILKSQAGFLQENTFAYRLTALGENDEARNLAKWIVREGATVRLLATGLPLLFVLPGLAVLTRRESGAGQRAAVLLVLGALVIVLGFAFRQPSWWNLLEVLLLAALVAGTARPDAAAPASRVPAWTVATVALALLPGLIALSPAKTRSADEGGFTKAELTAVAERDFAYWLGRRMGPDGAVVLAPPSLTASLIYHGGLRGIGSPYQENGEGFRGSVRLASASQADEALALARQRKLTHIVVPSWEGFLDEYARLGGTDPEHNLMAMLHQWLQPRWLRPIPYYLPRTAEFEDDRLLVFEMTEVQDHAAGLSRLTEYFLEMGQFELAGMAAQTLASDYGADLGAQVARARTAIAQRSNADFSAAMTPIMQALKDGADDALPWDRRVNLALVLAEARRTTEARVQAQRCLDEMGELDLRGLSEAALFRFLTLCKVLNLTIPDAQLRELSTTLLPPQLRRQLQPAR